MPVHQGKDSMGTFFQWGDHGKKYYYSGSNKKLARSKAAKQGAAIKISENRRGKKGGSRAKSRSKRSNPRGKSRSKRSKSRSRK
jgi:hypothetical protein